MIGYRDRARTQCEVVRLFRETHPDLPPLNQGTISKIEAQYREMGHVRKVPSKRQAVVDDDTKLNLLHALEENPITPARQLARDNFLYRLENTQRNVIFIPMVCRYNFSGSIQIKSNRSGVTCIFINICIFGHNLCWCQELRTGQVVSVKYSSSPESSSVKSSTEFMGGNKAIFISGGNK
ncbi:hypothetical protein NQ318_017650 [Aromia moschata]|uniref:DUF4817 domain-containing protein n=1 Tax=Aromia moschata TaxID=1265417 RepID=A0AAV8Z3R5_9CUCU|nr:hypothetical protein NQ318_017650 [Aromia moschata]